MGYLTNEGLMKTTIEMPDDLYRAAKAEAALRGRKLKDLIEEGLRLVLASSRQHPRPNEACVRHSGFGHSRPRFESGASCNIWP